MCGVYPAQDALTAGDEISSTYEGRHVTLREDELIHLTSGFVAKGDPVIFCLAGVSATHGWGVGVAFITGTATDDLIAVDTEGIWNLEVIAYDDTAGSAVVPGDPLYINTNDCVISKRRNLVTQIPFGYALGNLDASAEGTIAVKVHWDPEEQQDEFGTFADGHGADDLKKFTLIDQDDNASGMTRVVAIDGSYTADKTGTANFTGLAVDIAAGGTAQNVYGIEVYMATVADKAISTVCGYSCYFEDQGNVISNNMMLDLGRVSVHAALTRDTYIRIREHGAAVLAGSSFLLLEGNNAVGYMFNFMQAAGAEGGAAVVLEQNTDNTADSDYQIRVRLQNEAVDRFIRLYG